MDDAKRELRAKMKAIRSALPDEERARIDARITQQVEELAEYQSAQVLLAYLSFGTEIDTRALIENAWAQGKTVALPRCTPGTRQMTWHRIESFEDLDAVCGILLFRTFDLFVF